MRTPLRKGRRSPFLTMARASPTVSPVPVELVTIPSVPLIRVGTYDLSTGERTFTEEDLRAAANALATDPAVKAPRVKIDSVEQMLGLDPAAHGGEPAFGWFDNLKVSANGQDLLGDFHGPKSVADAMEWAYPSLSIEGTPPGWESATGRRHDLVVTAVAFLGVHWPGVSTLDDFTEFLAEGPKIEKTDAPDVILATTRQRSTPVAASLDQDMVGRRFYDGVESGEIARPEGVDSIWDLWIRSMRFDDTGQPYLKITDEQNGTLYRVDFTVSGNDVTFGDWVEVVEQDVPVTAQMTRLAAPLASWASRAESRAAMAINPEEANPSMTDEQRRAFAAAFGLADDATVEQVEAAAAAATEARAADPPADPPPDPTPVADPVPEPVAARAPLPEGVVAIDADELAQIRQDRQALAELRATRAAEDRDAVLTAAIREGRFAPARRQHYVTAWAADPQGTRHLLTASESDGGLAPNTVPVQAQGIEPQDVNARQGENEMHAQYMAGFGGPWAQRREGATA